MSLIVSDSGPIRYLVLIGIIDVVQKLYDHLIIPETVAVELQNAQTPVPVIEWIRTAPDWVEIRAFPVSTIISHLDAGENEAIAAAKQLGCPLLVDDLPARKTAMELGLVITGTVGTIVAASRAGYLNRAEAIDRLKLTNFRISDDLKKWLLRDELQS